MTLKRRVARIARTHASTPVGTSRREVQSCDGDVAACMIAPNAGNENA